MDNVIAAKLREIQNLIMNNGDDGELQKLIDEMNVEFARDGVYNFHFGDLGTNIIGMHNRTGYASLELNDFIEQAAQLFEATGVSAELKKMHMNNPLVYFQQLHQVRDIIKSRVEGFYKQNPNPSQEKEFWSAYNQIGCDGDFTYDKYDKLIKAVNSHGLPNYLLRSCYDLLGNQLNHGDAVEAVSDIVHVPTENKIPKGTRMTLTQFNPFNNYVEGNFNGTPWVFHGHQVVKV